MNRKATLVLSILIVIVLPFLAACGPAETPTAEPTAVPEPTEEEVVEPVGTLKIGWIAAYAVPFELDAVKGAQAWADKVNADGGLEIGGDRYLLEILDNDSGFNPATAQSAVNKLIFEEDVKFILSGSLDAPDSLFPITEENQVIFLSHPSTTPMLSPDNHYSFQTGLANMSGAIIAGWFSERYPDVKSVYIIAPDTEGAHSGVSNFQKACDHYGITTTVEWYPADATDLSALGTKVKAENPQAVSIMSGGPVLDGLVIKAVYEAGWHGTMFCDTPFAASFMLNFAPAEALEGLINFSLTTEYDPPLTDLGKELKDVWVAKYGSWENPDLPGMALWFSLLAALQEAGSTDVDAVADVLSNGLEFQTTWGDHAQMVARPDLGNDRTIDSVSDCYIKQVVNGQAEQIGYVSLDDAKDYFYALWSSD